MQFKNGNYHAATTVNGTTAFQQLLTSNSDRKGLIVSCQDNAIALKVSFDAAGADFFWILAGDSWQPELPPQNAIYVAAASGTPKITGYES